MNTMETQSNGIAKTDGAALPPISLSVDPARYRAEVDAFDITEEQKQELLAILWSIMRSFVELGFDFDVCGAVFNDDNTIPVADDLG